MFIMDYKGKQLLDQNIIDQIQKQADLILKNKDVLQAWQASKHLKHEISSFPQDQILNVLTKYRRITTKLKSLAIPLLSEEDIEHFLRNNLEFLDTKDEIFLSEGLIAWLASQEDNKQEYLKNKFSSAVDKNSVFAPKILEILHPKQNEKSNEISLNHNKQTVSNLSQHNQSIESVARQIFSQSETKQAEEIFVRRAKILIESRLRDVRTKIDIAEYLTRPFQVGGLELSGQALQSAEQLIEQAYSRIHGSMSLQAKPSKVAVVAPRPKTKHIILESKLKKSEIRQVKQVKINKEIKKSAQEKIDKLIKSEIPYRIPQKTTINGKIKIDDIKTDNIVRPTSETTNKTSKPVSLSGEFSSITISDFRLYGKSQQAIQKILDKIKVLEEDSIASKFEAIRNFKQSPLFKQYISIGEASLSQGKKLADSIADILINPDKITQEEFFAISDLNSKLK